MNTNFELKSFSCIIVFTLVFGQFAEAQELATYENWEEKAIQVYKSATNNEYESEFIHLMASVSMATLSEILGRKEYPVLRLAAFHAAAKRQPIMKIRLLVRLLLLAESISLYDKELELLVESPSKKIVAELARSLSLDLNPEQSLNLQLILIPLPINTLIELLKEFDDEGVPAGTIALVIEEACGRAGDWRNSMYRDELKDSLNHIKFAPGRSQLAIVWLYPFSNDMEAYKHVVFLLQDETLPDPAVVLALSRFPISVREWDSQLRSLPKKEVVSRRLDEFHEQFIREDGTGRPTE